MEQDCGSGFDCYWDYTCRGLGKHFSARGRRHLCVLATLGPDAAVLCLDFPSSLHLDGNLERDSSTLSEETREKDSS